MSLTVRPWALFLALAAALLAAAAQPGAAWARGRDDTPEELFTRGERQMRRGYYDEAIDTFERVRNHFPLNPWSVKAELRVADCLFEKAEYAAAVDAYRNFEKLHPQHPDLDYVVFRTAEAHFKSSHITAERDQTSTELALGALQGFESRFPQSRFAAEAAKTRGVARKRLAKRVEAVGDYYFWRGRLLRGDARATAMVAAARRYSQLLDAWPDLPLADRARYRLGMAHLYLGKVEEARAAFEEIRPSPDGKTSRYRRRADAALARPPKAVAAPAESAGPISPAR